MSPNHSAEYLAGLVRELCKLPHETEWVEFKHNNAEPQEIGEYISALSNAAALHGKTRAYLLWGIEDTTQAILGTTFAPAKTKVGNEELENWLLRLLAPKIDFRFFTVALEGKNIVVLEIDAAAPHPVQFSGQEFIRVGSYKKKLKDFPEKERALWRIFDRAPFEALTAVENVSDDEALRLLDYPAYFELLQQPLPANKLGILEALAADALLQRTEAGRWHITRLGAVLLAKKLADFPSLKRKAVRVVVYQGNSRVATLREQEGTRGYASGFEGLIGFINGLLPSNEVIAKALRKTVTMYPELAVRELVANALIHQDFFITGAGPMAEIFDDRMEISNPGVPLVEADRFLDTPPQSRNEALASLMRRFGICEERGSGVDKVVFQAELYQLPAPMFEVIGETTRAVMFAPRPLTKMDKADRVRACYLHACLKYVSRDYMTNTSIRERFGIPPHNSATASRLIKEALAAKFIRPYDETAARKMMKYVPFWA
jgi:predicted HTH transcriptional regulator